MFIKSINLNNIRSYCGITINFEQGSTLLSGDIGSGKSSILLSIDFALFGLSKGIINGEALLRHGEKQGSVELNFNIEGREIKIKRTLRRSGNSISQDSGQLTINNETTNLSPVELKQRVLQLLSYPQEILTKKSLIYRYTVYTPQEEMKSILLGKNEDRLDTLRKIFNIDKYKRIQENSRILSSELRLRIKENESLVENLEAIKKEKEAKINSINESKVIHSNFESELNKLTLKIKDKKNNLGEAEDNIRMFNECMKEFELNELKLKNSVSRSNENKYNLERLNKELLSIGKNELKEVDMNLIYKNLLNYRAKLGKLEEELIHVRKSLNESKYAYINSEKLINDISGLSTCPVCLQKVGEDHKHNILGKEEERINDLKDNIKIYTKKENELTRDIEIINGEIDKLKEMKGKNDMVKLKIKNINEKKDAIIRFEIDNNQINNEIAELKKKSDDLAKRIEEYKDTRYDEIRKELESLLDNEKNLLLKKNSVERDIANAERDIIRMVKEIEKKEDIKKDIFKTKKIKNFIDDDFSRLVETIERKVMLRVHNDFNELFIKWFNILVDDENISVRLDEGFSPVIEQNGYTTEYEYLSGGEKTAGALAYRLALNQVINNLIAHIKTKDILILDEPTDGFSEDQLDRLRLVLDELDIKQVIIVSHESKIESFVNNVIRLAKREGESVVV